MKNKILSLLIILAAINATASTNSVVATNRSVMVGTNGVLLAPTNFFAANQAALNAAVTGGGGSSSGVVLSTNIVFPGSAITNYSFVLGGNIIPTNAVYVNDTNGSSVWAGSVDYYIPTNVNTSSSYIVVWANVTNGDGIYDYLANNSFSQDGINISNFVAAYQLTGGTNPFVVYPGAQTLQTVGTIVGIKLYPVLATNITVSPTNQVPWSANYTNGKATFTGNFIGNGSGLQYIPDTALSANVQLQSKKLQAFASYPDNNGHFLVSSNVVATLNYAGSTLNIQSIGSAGFADINFIIGGTPGNPGTLKGALGVGVAGINQWPYNDPYWECFGNNHFDWVEYGLGVLGRVNGITGDLQWFGNNNNPDGSGTNTVFFETVRSNLSVVIGGPTGGFLVLSNAPTLNATNAAASITVGVTAPKLFFSVTNNGVVYRIPAY